MNQILVFVPSSHNTANHKIIIFPSPWLPPSLPLSSLTATTRRPSRRSPTLLPPSPALFAARRLLLRLLHVVNLHLPHRPTRKTRHRPSVPSSGALPPRRGCHRRRPTAPPRRLPWMTNPHPQFLQPPLFIFIADFYSRHVLLHPVC